MNRRGILVSGSDFIAVQVRILWLPAVISFTWVSVLP